MFSCEFYEISHNTFIKEPFGWLLLHKWLSCFQKQPPEVLYVKRCSASALRGFLSQNKRLWHRRFPVNFVKFLRTPSLQNTFLTEHLWRTASMFSKIMSHIFSGWVFFRLNLKTGNKSELNILNPQPKVYFQPSQTSARELFLQK